jgi:hypothetical protein
MNVWSTSASDALRGTLESRLIRRSATIWPAGVADLQADSPSRAPALAQSLKHMAFCTSRFTLDSSYLLERDLTFCFMVSAFWTRW